jgi:hypothetical protein
MPAKKKTPKVFKPLLSPDRIRNILRELPENRKRIVENIEFRKNVLEKQNRDNFANEYQRLHGYLTGHTLPGLAAAQGIRTNMNDLKNRYKESLTKTGSIYEDTIVKEMTATTRPPRRRQRE